MQIDPVTAAVVGALVTVVGLFYRDLLKQLLTEKTEKLYWRERYFTAMGRAEVATDEATKHAK